VLEDEVNIWDLFLENVPRDAGTFKILLRGRSDQVRICCSDDPECSKEMWDIAFCVF
jgi:hypothetical protein